MLPSIINGSSATWSRPSRDPFPHVLTPADLGDQATGSGTEFGARGRRDPEQERHRQCPHRDRAALVVKTRPELPQGPVGSFGVPRRERGEQAGNLLARAVEVPELLPGDLVVPEPVLAPPAGSR
ncbi:hypothetical protein [Streptomyces pseudogriseolus]|uniref:hypothetical protein n=1 Tax=Streptomyces pseudogriseolus TaxID=36817 RepID=UPI003FA1AEB9